jgi:hypothetical protein
MADKWGPVYDLITLLLSKGKVVPVLGAGVNLSERPQDVSWEPGQYQYLPNGQELAARLAYLYGRNVIIDRDDLARVSQYVTVKAGQGRLYDELHDIFNADFPPTLAHRFLAQLPRRTRKLGETRKCMLIMTTNYDDCLERAFIAEREPYELVTYIAEGQFRHTTTNGETTVIDRPNEYVDLDFGERSVIAKMHGAVDRIDGADSFVITEDHYTDYLTRADFTSLFPVTLVAKLQTSHFLFLGHSLRDWNFRVMLYRLWKKRKQMGKDFKSWAVQADPDPIDKAVWDERGIDILPIRVEDFVREIEKRLPPENGETP